MHEGTVRLGRGTNWESLLPLGDATVSGISRVARHTWHVTGAQDCSAPCSRPGAGLVPSRGFASEVPAKWLRLSAVPKTTSASECEEPCLPITVF